MWSVISRNEGLEKGVHGVHLSNDFFLVNMGAMPRTEPLEVSQVELGAKVESQNTCVFTLKLQRAKIPKYLQNTKNPFEI